MRASQLGIASFWIDEAFSIEAALSIFDRKLQFLLSGIDPSQGGERGPLYHYLLSLVIRLFEASATAVRWPSVLAGILLVVSSVLFCWRYFGLRSAVVLAILSSFSYWYIAWSRQAREYMLLTLLVWLGLFVIYWLWKRPISEWLKATIIAAIVLISTGVHIFGLVLLAAIFFRWVTPRIFAAQGASAWRWGVVIVLSTLVPLAILRQALNSSGWYFDIYGGFILNTYWPLIIPISLLWFAEKTQLQKELLFWLGITSLYGLVFISAAVPLVNPRYVFFLTPVLYLFSAVGIGLFLPERKAFFTVVTAASILLFTAFDLLVWTAQPEYKLESQKGRGGFVYYTPQPDFKDAYQYINTRLGDINLVTPYPVISRRYRKRDDIMVIDAGVSNYLTNRRNEIRFEPYTKIFYANANALIQMLNQLNEVYVLVDQHALQRVSFPLKTMITSGTLLKKWAKSPYSDLYLYKLNKNDKVWK